MRGRVATVFLLALIPLSSCYDFNNPVDPEAENYQGFPSENPSSPSSLPAAPGALVLSAIASDPEHGVRLTWTDNADNEEGFRIERRIPPASFAEIATVAADVVQYDDLTVSPDTTYEFRVCAYNAAGDSTFESAPAWTTAPARLAGISAMSLTPGVIRLTLLDASTTNDTFIIERSTDGVNFVEVVEPGVLGPNSQTWEDTGLTSGVDYWYRIYAYRTSDSQRSRPYEIGSITCS